MKFEDLEILKTKVSESEVTSVLVKHGLIKRVIKEIIVERIVKKELDEFNEDERENTLEHFKKQNNIQDEEQLKRFVATNGLTIKELIDSLIRPLAIRKYRNKRWEGEVVRQYYNNKELYDNIEFKMIILVNKNLAQEIYFRLKDKESTWEQLCRELEIDYNSIKYGPIRKDELETEIRNEIDYLKIDEIARPFKLRNGIAICQLVKYNDGKPTEEVKEDIVKKKFDEMIENEVQKTLSLIKN